MKKSAIKIIICILSMIAVLIGGMSIGILSVNHEQQKQQQADTVRSVAVVNLDEGRISEESRIYYAAQIMEMPNDRFRLVSLTEARTGIQEGTFAAYIIIPGTFSECVWSINSKPESIGLEYAINPNLKEEIRAETVADIHDFETLLNSNMSYIYISAILEEFHQVQDGAGTLLANDRKDLDNIESIDREGFMNEPQYEMPEELENVIEDIDLKDVYEENIQLVEIIEKFYRDFYEEAETEFRTLKEDQSEMTGPMLQLTETFANFNAARDGEGNLVYQGGLTEFLGMAESYNGQLETERNSLMKRLGLGSYIIPGPAPQEPGNPVSSLPEQIQAAIDEIEQDNEALNVILEELQSAIEALQQDPTEQEADDLEEIIAEKAEEAMTLNASIKTKTTALSGLLGSEFGAVIEDINTTLLRGIDKDAFLTVLQEKIVDILQDHVDTQAVAIGTAMLSTEEGINSYLEKIEEYDPYQNYDPGPVDTSLAKLNENIVTIQSDMNDKNYEYRGFVDEVYSRSQEIEDGLLDSVQEAHTLTGERLGQILEEFKQSRTQIHQTNSELLNSFMLKLPYTRLGSVDYTQVYNFIVKPVEMQQTTVKNLSIRTRDNPIVNDPVVLTMTALVVLAGTFLLFRVMLEIGKPEEWEKEYRML